jgi:pimeloyl-ACP methyl ester carboxylesterase
LLRPDRVRGVVGLSVPYAPRGPVSTMTALHAVFGDGFYMAYFAQPGVADAELGRNVTTSMRRFLYSASGNAPRPAEASQPVIPPGAGMLDILAEPDTLPSWLTQADLDFYVAEFERTGFTGGLNWYRAIDLGWELMAAWQGAPVLPPALYIAGDRDLVVNFPGMNHLIPNLRMFVPNLKKTVMLPGCGHWTQQERASEVNTALVEFLNGL